MKKNWKMVFTKVSEHYASFWTKNSIWPLLKGGGEGSACRSLVNVQFEASFMKQDLTVGWRDVMGGFWIAIFKVGEEDSCDLYHPLKIHVPKCQIKLLQNLK